MSNPDYLTISEAVRCLGQHGEVAHVAEVLLPLVTHSDWSVRAEAIEVLAARRVARAAPAILRLLETESDPFVREAVLRALDGLRG